METKPTVFVVDDDPAARESVASLARSHGLLAETFDSAEAFLGADASGRRGCIVTDVRMTGMSGLELQEQLRENNVQLPVVVITGYADVPMAVRAMKAGAVTFLEKPCANDELWKNIQWALRIEREKQAERERRDEIVGQLTHLTPDELKVLEFVFEGESNKVIAAKLDIGLRTVELRRSNIMHKLQANSLAELVRKVMIAGPVAAGH